VSLFSDTICENGTPWRFEAKRVSQEPNDGSFPKTFSSTVKRNSFQFFATTTLTPAESVTKTVFWHPMTKEEVIASTANQTNTVLRECIVVLLAP
jgi:hypothetical protein